MNRACTTCKHSARCLTQGDDYIPVLFQEIARSTPWDPLRPGDVAVLLLEADKFAAKLRKLLVDALPDNCPLMTPERRKHTEVHWEVVGDEFRMRLMWPKVRFGGGISIWSLRV
jgi:hypothetical protein